MTTLSEQEYELKKVQIRSKLIMKATTMVQPTPKSTAPPKNWSKWSKAKQVKYNSKLKPENRHPITAKEKVKPDKERKERLKRHIAGRQKKRGMKVEEKKREVGEKKKEFKTRAKLTQAVRESRKSPKDQWTQADSRAFRALNAMNEKTELTGSAAQELGRLRGKSKELKAKGKFKEEAKEKAEIKQEEIEAREKQRTKELSTKERKKELKGKVGARLKGQKEDIEERRERIMENPDLSESIKQQASRQLDTEIALLEGKKAGRGREGKVTPFKQELKTKIQERVKQQKITKIKGELSKAKQTADARIRKLEGELGIGLNDEQKQKVFEQFGVFKLEKKIKDMDGKIDSTDLRSESVRNARRLQELFETNPEALQQEAIKQQKVKRANKIKGKLGGKIGEARKENQTASQSIRNELKQPTPDFSKITDWSEGINLNNENIGDWQTTSSQLQSFIDNEGGIDPSTITEEGKKIELQRGRATTARDVREQVEARRRRADIRSGGTGSRTAIDLGADLEDARSGMIKTVTQSELDRMSNIFDPAEVSRLKKAGKLKVQKQMSLEEITSKNLEDMQSLLEKQMSPFDIIKKNLEEFNSKMADIKKKVMT